MKPIRYYVIGGIAAGLFTCLPIHSYAQVGGVPRQMSYQGVLREGDKIPADGMYSVTIALYDKATGGQPLWQEMQTVEVKGGLFNIILGQYVALPAPLPADAWIGINFNGMGEMPRTKLTSSAYSFNAATAQSLMPNATGAVLSLNGQQGALELRAADGFEVRADKGVLTIGKTSQAKEDETLNQGTEWLLAGNSNATANSWLGTSNNIPLVIRTSNTERMRILSSNGNVGIGETNPASRLSVARTLHITNTGGTPELKLSAPSGANSTTFKTTGQSANITYTLPPDDGDANDVLTTNGSGVLTWTASGWGTTGNNATNSSFLGTTNAQPLIIKTNNVERYRVTSGGAMGINEDNPTQKLEVAGNVVIKTDGSGTGELRLQEPSGNMGNNYTGFKAGNLPTNIIYTLPTASPLEGQVLSSNAQGILVWTTPGGASGAAGGDLAGTYPNPTIAPKGANTGEVLKWDGTEWNPATDIDGSLQYFTEVRTITAPNDIRPVHQFAASGTESNIDIALTPKGTGALTAQVANNAASGGNKRGANAIDLQMTRIFSNQVASGDYAIIGGGEYNTASGNHAIVNGGQSNVASNFAATISGGQNNAASGSAATISGGQNNIASNTGSVIGGGQNNTASNFTSTVAGGLSNTASGQMSAIGGGQQNTVSGDNSTINGGSQNTVSGTNSSIVGGRGLTLSGDGSVGFVGNNSGGTRNMSVSTTNTAVLGNVDLWLANNDNTPRALRFYEQYNTAGAYPNGSNYVGFRAPNSIASDVTWTLPDADGTSGQVLTTNGSGTLSWVTTGGGAAGGDLTGTYPNPTIANDAVISTKIADDAVTSAKIADASIVNADISTSAAIAYSKLSLTNSIQNSDIVANAITTSKVANGTVTTSKLADSAVSGLKLLTKAVQTGHLNDAIVTTAKIANNAVTTAKISSSGASSGNVMTYDGTNVVWAAPSTATTVTNSTLAGDGSAGNPLRINLGNSNTWTANQTFASTFLIASNTRIALTNSDNNGRDIRWQEPSGTGTQYIGWRAPNVSNNGNYVFPATVGSVGQVLGITTSNGIDSARTSWVTPTISGDAGGDLTGTYPNPTVANNAITTAKIADASVTTPKLADAAITPIKLSSTGATTGQALTFDGTNIVWGAPALSGTAGGDLTGTYPNPTVANNAITTSKILDANVTTAKIADAAVTPIKLSSTGATTGQALTFDGTNIVWGAPALSGTAGGDLTGTYPNPTVANNAITTSKILDANVTTAKIADAAVTPIKLSSTGATTGQALTFDGTNIVWGVPTLSGTAGGDLTGTYPNPTVANNAITTSKILDANVTTPKLADAAVTTPKLADAAVTTPKLADAAVTPIKLSSTGATTGQALTFNGTNIVWGAPALSGTAGGDLTGTYPNPTIANDAVISTKIADDAVTSAKIADASIVNADISTSAAIAYSKLSLTNSIQNSDIVANAITTSKVANGTVTTSKLADSAVSGLKLLTKAVQTGHLNDAIVTTAKIANNAVTTAKISSSGASSGNVMTYDGTNVVWAAPSTATTVTNSTLAGDGSAGNPLRINLGNSNTWTANQTFASTFLIASNTRIALTNSDNNGRDIRWQEPSGTGTQYIGWRAPNVSNNGNYVFPATVGSVGQVLGITTSNGIDSARTSWVTPTISGDAGGDLTGTYPNPTIANDAVTSTKIADASIVNADISTSAAIAYSKLSLTNSIQNSDIVANAITTSKVANGTVTTSKLADSAVSGLKLLTKAVQTGHLNDAIVTTAKIANNAVNGTKIALGSDANGDIMYYNGTDYTRRAIGTDGQVLTVSGGVPTWADPSGGGSSVAVYSSLAIDAVNNITITNTTARFHRFAFSGTTGTSTDLNITLPDPSSYPEGTSIHFICHFETTGGSSPEFILTTPSGSIYAATSGKGQTNFSIGTLLLVTFMCDGVNYYRAP